jgi:hypothetical protein
MDATNSEHVRGNTNSRLHTISEEGYCGQRMNASRYIRRYDVTPHIKLLGVARQTRAHWGRLWRKSPRYARTNRIDPNLMQRSFIKLAANFPKRLTSLYISLRSQHIPLNKYLHCAHCPQIEETVHHYILDYPKYRRQRYALTYALGRKSSSLPYLLSDADATPHLVKYINGTQRLKATYGEVPLPTKHPD